MVADQFETVTDTGIIFEFYIGGHFHTAQIRTDMELQCRSSFAHMVRGSPHDQTGFLLRCGESDFSGQKVVDHLRTADSFFIGHAVNFFNDSICQNQAVHRFGHNNTFLSQILYTIHINLSIVLYNKKNKIESACILVRPLL